MEIKLEKISDNLYDVWFNINYLGRFVLDTDGFYDFLIDDNNNNGYWSAYQLRAIADKLDEVNKPYNDSLDEYFKNRDNIGDLTLDF